MANLRRKSGLGKDPERARTRAAQLTAIDPDWNCPWPLHWQRHYAVLKDLVDADGPGILTEIRPGVIVDGDDLGRWIQRQQRDWNLLTETQRERLVDLGLKPTQQPTPAPTRKGAARSPQKASGKPSAALSGRPLTTHALTRPGTAPDCRIHPAESSSVPDTARARRSASRPRPSSPAPSPLPVVAWPCRAAVVVACRRSRTGGFPAMPYDGPVRWFHE